MLKLKEKANNSSLQGTTDGLATNNKITVFDRKNFITNGNVVKLIGTAAHGVRQAGKTILSAVTGTISKTSAPIAKVKDSIATLGKALKNSKVVNLLKFREQKLPAGGFVEEDNLSAAEDKAEPRRQIALTQKDVGGFIKRIEKKKKR